MKTASINSKEIISGYQNRLKPNAFLQEGKRIFNNLRKNKAIIGTMSNIVNGVHRPGIFKRVFIVNPSHGLPYLTAQAMMTATPMQYSKILSLKLTDNITPMILHRGDILVSCAGTVGNVRLIDKYMDGTVGSQDIIRVITKDDYGFCYAYLASKPIYSYIQSQLYGSVVSRIEPDIVKNIPLIGFEEGISSQIDGLIKETLELRENAISELRKANQLLKVAAGLRDLTPEDYDYYGLNNSGRKVSCFVRRRKDIDTTTINAFNHSERIRKTKASMPCKTVFLKEVLVDGNTFSTGSFPRVEVKEGNGIMLINQKDIFDNIIKGKYISKRNVKVENLVEYGEVIIAGVGTLGETETLCRTVFANEDLAGQLVSGEFIRMKTNGKVPSGYLYAWLASDYGFRLLRNLQAGTKLCRPIPRLVLEIPVPIVDKETMEEIDNLVKDAYTKRYLANCNERKAISMVEQEIESWNK